MTGMGNDSGHTSAYITWLHLQASSRSLVLALIGLDYLFNFIPLSKDLVWSNPIAIVLKSDHAMSTTAFTPRARRVSQQDLHAVDSLRTCSQRLVPVSGKTSAYFHLFLYPFAVNLIKELVVSVSRSDYVAYHAASKN
jgi:hypothetical protein